MRIGIIQKIDESILKELAANEPSQSEILRKLGLRAAGGNHRSLQKRFKELGIHFTKSKPPKTPISISNEKLFTKNNIHSRSTVRKRILANNLLEYVCQICRVNPVWNGRTLTLRLDHINGEFNDHRLENLRWICPNCDSQLDTYGSRNKGKLSGFES